MEQHNEIIYQREQCLVETEKELAAIKGVFQGKQRKELQEKVEDGLYYSDLKLPEGTQYQLGKYEMMRKEYLKKHRQGKYIKLLLDGKLNEHLHEVDEEGSKKIESLVEQMKIGVGITEELKVIDQMKWVREMNCVRSVAEEIVFKEVTYF